MIKLECTILRWGFYFDKFKALWNSRNMYFYIRLPTITL
jgi:hypothetical protein